MAGVSRSATIVAAYMIRKYTITTAEAVSRLQDRRKQVCPNPGFMQQLGLLEENILKTKADQPKRKVGRVKTEENDKNSCKDYNQKIPFNKASTDNSSGLVEKSSKKDYWKIGGSMLLAKDRVKEEDVNVR